jgi:GTP-binding protein
LIDSRLEPQQIDLEFLSWLAETGRAFDLVFTKTDKLKPAKTEKNIAEFLAAIAPCRPEFHRSSAQTGEGRREILGRLGSFLREGF